MISDWRERWELISNLPFWAIAFVWRTLLVRTTFIAITGSFGKTTTKDCLAMILSSIAPTIATIRNHNGRRGITRTILRARPWHRFVVVEAGTDRPGGMVRASLLLRPDIAIILGAGRSHSDAFKTVDDVAREKSQLLRFLRRKGTAALNGDDMRVAAMRDQVPGSVITFGETPACDVIMTLATASWPNRLQLTITTASETESVQTQLVGTHWAKSVLGAAAAAKVCRVSLRQVRAALATLASYQARMHPETLPNGAVVLRDDYNGSIDSFEQAIEVLRNAQAERRILVVTDCSDFRRKPRERQHYFARMAREVSEVAVFVGERSTHALRRAITEGMDRSCVHACFTLEQAAELLRTQLRAGDLVLLRGRAQDHLARIYFRLRGDVDCKLVTCRKRCLCDDCEELGFRLRH